MIFGGRWTTQNKKTPGSWINFVSKRSNGTPSEPAKPVEPVEPTNYLLLKDKNGVLLKTADGYYLAVRSE